MNSTSSLSKWGKNMNDMYSVTLFHNQAMCYMVLPLLSLFALLDLRCFILRSLSVFCFCFFYHSFHRPLRKPNSCMASMNSLVRKSLQTIPCAFPCSLVKSRVCWSLFTAMHVSQRSSLSVNTTMFSSSCDYSAVSARCCTVLPLSLSAIRKYVFI